MELTLFGAIESLAESRARAERISLLLSRLADAPEERQCLRYHYKLLKRFIDRAHAHTFDANEHDGLQRLAGDLSDLLTDDDRHEMTSNPKIWKPYPRGWMGVTDERRHRFCTTLHPKEIAYLEQIRTEQVEAALEMRDALRAWRKELKSLRDPALPDLPEAIAKRHQLTPKGERIKK